MIFCCKCRRYLSKAGQSTMDLNAAMGDSGRLAINEPVPSPAAASKYKATTNPALGAVGDAFSDSLERIQREKEKEKLRLQSAAVIPLSVGLTPRRVDWTVFPV
jgi:hypothetical protein